jgi:hypothetical protein
LFAGVFAIVACARRQSEELVTREDVAPRVDAAKPTPRPKWPADVPNAYASCNAHSECAILVEAPQTDPCCTHRLFLPVTRAYADWTARFQDENCKGVSCPSQPLPGPEPACCASIGRCINHKCLSGCDDPTLNAPKVTWLESECRQPMP